MTAVIVVCVGIAIAILISFWMSRVLTLSSAGSSPERLEVMSGGTYDTVHNRVKRYRVIRFEETK